ncbi:MAG: acyltransferase [Luteolibacter sp.]
MAGLYQVLSSSMSQRVTSGEFWLTNMKSAPLITPHASRLEILDALRGIAAIAVAVFHFTNAMRPNFFQEASYFGQLGVDVFFVISGFIIPYSLARSRYCIRKDYGRYLLKRAARLHPPFLASVLLAILLWHLSAFMPGFRGQAPTYDALQVGLHALLANGILGKAWLQPVYWTLAIEFQFYLVAGLVTPLCTAASRSMGFTISTLLLLSLLPVPKVWIIPYLPLFVMGMLAFIHDRGGISSRILLVGIIVSAALGIWSLSWQQMLAGSLTSLAIAYVRVPMPKPLLFFGSISYSLYLVHVLLGGRIINFAGRYNLGPMPAQIAASAVALVVSMIGAYIWFRIFELPAQRWSSAIRYSSSTSPK